MTDINRRAAAIECYLDLSVNNSERAKIIWTNYKKELEVYQGALEHKEFYVKEFLKQTAATIANDEYDKSKLEAVFDLIVAECTAIAVNQHDLSASPYE
jgi:hypothetical protein